MFTIILLLYIESYSVFSFFKVILIPENQFSSITQRKITFLTFTNKTLPFKNILMNNLKQKIIFLFYYYFY